MPFFVQYLNKNIYYLLYIFRNISNLLYVNKLHLNISDYVFIQTKFIQYINSPEWFSNSHVLSDGAFFKSSTSEGVFVDIYIFYKRESIF